MAAQTCVALQLTQAVPRGGSGAVFCYHSCFPNQAQEQPYGPGPAGTHRLTVEGPGHLWVSVSSSSLTKQGLLFSHKLQETRAPLPKALLLALVLFGS